MSMYASPPPPLPPHSHYYGYPGYDVYAPAPVQHVYWGRLCLGRSPRQAGAGMVGAAVAVGGGGGGAASAGGQRWEKREGAATAVEQPPETQQPPQKKTPPVARAVGCGVRVDRGFCESWWAGARERRRRGDGTGTGRGRRAREWGVFGFGRVDAGLATLAFGASGGRLRDGEAPAKRDNGRGAGITPRTSTSPPPPLSAPLSAREAFGSRSRRGKGGGRWRRAGTTSQSNPRWICDVLVAGVRMSHDTGAGIRDSTRNVGRGLQAQGAGMGHAYASASARCCCAVRQLRSLEAYEDVKHSSPPLACAPPQRDQHRNQPPW
ncbi:hypothetical protein B0H11DRAFT_1935383 [Mycena galericulata]|nr:hypothetical protein B0H11DRAFT_1935383 [Mycena galericulata]